MYDVAIIGAGPAGSTLARLIAGRHNVLLVDKRTLTEEPTTGWEAKCCGGLLAPDAQAMLSRMRLGLPKSVLVGPQLFVVRAIDVQRRLERYYQRYYINMNRHRFDCWLLSMVPPNVELRLGWRFKSYQRHKDHFTITLVKAGKSCQEHARILVGADGGSSKIRKLALPGQPFPKAYIAIQHWLEAHHQQPYFSTLFDPEITDYYCWTIPKEGCLIVGAALQPRHDVTGKFELFKSKLRDRGFHFGKLIRKEAACILRPFWPQHISTGKDGIALIGEAGGFISPSSAEGFSYAFKSAIHLADVLSKSPHDFEKRFRSKTRRLRANLLIKNMKSHVIYNPGLRNIVMRTGLKTMKIRHS
ncbi:MAG: FAD-binding protein [Phycisphaerales bacterium]|nr:MAG: FAD-binding protein [Phycisphaerales bacterium]